MIYIYSIYQRYVLSVYLFWSFVFRMLLVLYADRGLVCDDFIYTSCSLKHEDEKVCQQKVTNRKGKVGAVFLGVEFSKNIFHQYD